MDERMNFSAAWRGYLSRLRVAGIVWAVTLGLLLFFTRIDFVARFNGSVSRI